MRILHTACLAVVLSTLAGCSSATRPPLEVYWLANEGVMLRAGGQAVLIDAFVPEPYSIYTSLPADVATDLLAGSAPFDGIDLALVSHTHRDHFQPAFAAQYLAAHPQVQLVSSPQVDALLDGEQETRFPRAGDVARIEHAGVEVAFLNLSHGKGRFAAIENLGHVVEIGGYRVLHIGDAEMYAKSFEAYAETLEGLDVALIPYWYFAGEHGRALVDTYFDAPLQIAVHLPGSGEDDDNLNAARASGAIVPDRPLQRWTVAQPRHEQDGAL